MEDILLIIGCRCRSQRALERVYRKYKRDLLLLAMSLVNDPGAAEDIVHDVFVRFVETLEDFRLTGSLKGYLLVCVANNARNRIKADQRHQRSEPDSGERYVVDDPVYTLICNEQTRQLAQAMGQLPYDQREVILLHMHGGMSLAAIAKTLDVPVNTVKSRYRYGLDRLRQIFNGEVKS